MPFVIPAFDEVRTFLLAAMSGRFPNANVNQRGTIYKLLSTVGLGITDVNFNLRQVQLDLMPDTAEGDFLSRWLTIYGLARKGAVGAAKSDGLRVFGDVAATVPSAEPMSHAPSGLLFQTASGGVIPAAGFLDVDVVAVSTGEATNLEVGQELQFGTTPTGLEANARIVLELEDGIDSELDDAARARLLNRIGQPAAGGNRNDYEQFLLQSAAFVATGYVYPNRNGLGTVDLAALKNGSGSIRALDAGERATVAAFIDSERPVSATTRILTTNPVAQDVEILILPENDPSFVFDWDDSVPPTVLTYVSSTRTLTFNAARPGNMSAGDRLIIKATTGSTGVEHVIEALSGTDAVILEADISEVPAAADPVYSGSPITADIRAAIIALFDALGPANPDANPYGPWEGNIRLSTLFETVQTRPGVLDSTIVVPVANIVASDPAFPSNDNVDYLVPGEILVRRV